MNSHQRRKHKRSIDRLYKITFGCTFAEFVAGRTSNTGLILNGSTATAKTWSSKTPEQILADINELLMLKQKPEEFFYDSIRYSLLLGFGIPRKFITGIEGI